MLYGSLKKLLATEYTAIDDTVLVESSFKETTRNGKKTLRLVQLGLTSKAFIIASETDLRGRNTTDSEGNLKCRESSIIEMVALYPWESITLTVFKRSKKQCLKATFESNDKQTRYFELSDSPKKKIFWTIWCLHVKELGGIKKKWPFLSPSKPIKKQQQQQQEFVKLRFVKNSDKRKRAKWLDKCLYLGSEREIEDNIRPVPVPGLGRTEEIKLLYLKPRYFGCWEQSEHWVQVGTSSSDMIDQNEDKE